MISGNPFWESRLREIVASRGDPRTIETLLRQSARQIADLDNASRPPKPLKPIPWRAPQPKQPWWVLFKQNDPDIQKREDVKAVWDETDPEQVAWAMMTSSPDEGRRWRIDAQARKFYCRNDHAWAQVMEAVESRNQAALRAAWQLAKQTFPEFAEVELCEFYPVVRRCELTLNQHKRNWFLDRHTIG
jgi:hypothetical protein